MKQVIFLGFYCQIYKKAPTARIYVGDNMIDEIEIPEFYTEKYLKDNKLWFSTTSIEKKEKGHFMAFRSFTDMELHPVVHEKIHRLDTFSWQKKITPSYYSFEDICLKDPIEGSKKNIKHPKIFVYIIDDEILKSSNSKITIKIQNSDSNYINGFMTKSTLLYLSIFYIMPYELFKNPIKTTQRYLDTWGRKATATSLKKIINFYKKFRFEWPINLNGYFNIIKDKEKINNTVVVGGNCNFEIELKKKYHIWWSKDIKFIGFFYANYLFVKNFIVDLSNKYKQNEN